MRPGLPAALAAAALLLATACAAPQPTPYKAQDGGHGYSETRLEDGTWRIAFAANRLVARDRLEDYALLRAAELARSQGFPRFAVVDRVYERHTDRTYAYNARPGRADARTFHRRAGSSYVDPFANSRITTVVTQVARIDIRPAGAGAAPEGAIRVHDAAEVIARLGALARDAER